MKHASLRSNFRVLTWLALCLAVLLCLASCNAAGSKESFDMMDDVQLENGFAPGEKAEVTVDLPDRKIIKTYNLELETKTFDDSIQALMTLVGEKNGYVESSNVRNQSLNGSSTSYRRYANYTLRIPADRADAFVSAVGDAFHVTGNVSSVQDVSDTYYSIEAILEELYAERDSLLNIMESLDTKSDYNFWLTVEQRLTEVKQEIAVYQAQLKSYDQKVAYSTLQISITEVLVYSAQAESNRFGSRISAAFRESWSDFAMGCQNFAVWFVGAIPTLLVLGVIALSLVLILRAAFSKKRKQRNSHQDPPSPQ